MPAEDLLKAGRAGGPVIDGWFLPEDVATIFSEDKQNDVPLLVGSNKDEGTFFLQPTTAEKFIERSRARFGDQADAFLKLYPAGSDEEANASQLAAFRDELAFVMRVWARAQTKTGHSKAFLYYFTHEPPPPAGLDFSRWLWFGRHSRIRSAVYFPKPVAAARLDGPGSSSLGHALVILGELRDRTAIQMERVWRSGPPLTIRKSDRPMVLGDQAEVGPAPNRAQLAFFEQLYEKERGSEH